MHIKVVGKGRIGNMLATTINNALKDFDKTCDKVVQNCEPIIITRSNNDNVVLISQSEYDNLMENIYIRKSEASYARLLESIEEAKAGKLTSLDSDRCQEGNFDYTKWQREHFDSKGDMQLREEIKDFCDTHHYDGKATIL